MLLLWGMCIPVSKRSVVLGGISNEYVPGSSSKVCQLFALSGFPLTKLLRYECVPVAEFIDSSLIYL